MAVTELAQAVPAVESASTASGGTSLVVSLTTSVATGGPGTRVSTLGSRGQRIRRTTARWNTD